MKTSDALSKKHNRNKRITVIALIAVVVVALAVGVLAIVNMLLKKDEPEREYDFYPADYSENIYYDYDYMEKDRSISFTDDMGVTYSLDGDYAKYDPALPLFSDFFSALKSGDAETLNSLFDESYFAENDRYEKFTRQKIYDIEIAVSGQETDDGDTAVYSVYYKIKDNTGTFRSDVGSDMARRQWFFIIENDGGYKITDIVY